jgi:hypothetical protein
MNFGPNIYSELLSLLCAIFCWGRLGNSFMRWFIVFLALTLSVEMSSHILYQNNIQTYRTYIIFDTVTVVFYTWIFIRFALESRLKKWMLYIGSARLAITPLYYLLFSMDIQPFPQFYLFIISGMQLVVFSCLLYFQYLKADDLSTVPQYKAGLWYASGILIFYAGTTLVLSLIYYILQHNLKIGNEYLYNFVPRYLSIILYGCLSISFLTWNTPNHN